MTVLSTNKVMWGRAQAWERFEIIERLVNTRRPTPVSKKRKRLKNRWRKMRGFALDEVNNLSDATFQSMFRMSRSAFEKLHDEIGPLMNDTDEEMARRSSGTPISKKTKLYVTLRWLAGGSYHDLCFGWGISKAAFYSTDPQKGVVWPTIEAIDKAFEIGIPYDNLDQLKLTAEKFDEFTNCPNKEMFGCVTAIDGWVCHTRKPTQDEVTDTISYRNRKNCWGVVVLAGCDSELRYTMFSVKSSGSTNDVTAWDLSENNYLLTQEHKLHPDYYFIGDEAFVCLNQFLVPYSGRSLSVGKDAFNYNLSAMRQCIERSFALLTQRWGIFWRYLRIDYERWPILLTAVAKLHNFCIDNSPKESTPRLFQDCVDDLPQPIIVPDTERKSEQTKQICRRSLITERIIASGIRRPHF